MSELLFNILPNSIKSILFPAPRPATYDNTMESLQWTKPLSDQNNNNDIGTDCFSWSSSSSSSSSSYDNNNIVASIENIPFILVCPASNDKYLTMKELHKKYGILIVYSHGNAMDLGLCYECCKYYSTQLNVPFLAYEYPGYGLMDKVPITTSAINSTLLNVLSYCRNEMNWPTKQIILFGQSIGTGPSTYASRHHGSNIGGLILLSPYTSIADVAYDITGGGWLSGILTHAVPHFWNNCDNIAHIPQNLPVLIIHGKLDEVIPFEHSLSLFHACSSKNIQIHFPKDATHNIFDDKNDIIKPIENLLRDKK